MVSESPVRKALVLVKGLDRTVMVKLGERRKMTTSVKRISEGGDAVDTENKYTLIAHCHGAR